MAGNPLDFKKTIIHSAGSGVNASDSSAGRASLPSLNYLSSNSYVPTCPYFSVLGSYYIQCTIYAHIKARHVFGNSADMHRYYDNVCRGNFHKCECYQKCYDEEIKSTNKYVQDFKKCAFCCNNSGYTGLKKYNGSTYSFCQLWQVEKESYNPGATCEWFNRNGIVLKNGSVFGMNKCITCDYCVRSDKDITCSESFMCNNSSHCKGTYYFAPDAHACDNYKCDSLARNADTKTCADCFYFGDRTDKLVGFSYLYKCNFIFANGYTGNTKPTIPACKHFKERDVEPMTVSASNASYFVQENCKNAGCEHNRNNKCGLVGVKGNVLKHFVNNVKENECIHIIRLRLKYLREIRNCNNANDNCSAISCNIAVNNDYCCYNCQQPCERRCAHSDDLVPYGLIKLKYGNYDLLTAENLNNPDPDAALNNHLQYIRKKSEDVVNNYVEIGFALISLRDSKLYKARGYSNLIECIEAELGMKKSTAYNLMKIAEKFGDPETKRLAPQYSQYNYVQCLEMSTMTDEELAQVTSDMSRREMKKLKDSNRLESKKAKDITIDPYDENIIDITVYTTESNETENNTSTPSNEANNEPGIEISFVRPNVQLQIKKGELDPKTANEINHKIDVAGSCIRYALETIQAVKKEYYNDIEKVYLRDRCINQLRRIMAELNGLKINASDHKQYNIIIDDGSNDLAQKLAAAEKKIKDLELALKQSKDAHKSKNESYQAEIKRLQDKINELTSIAAVM